MPDAWATGLLAASVADQKFVRFPKSDLASPYRSISLFTGVDGRAAAILGKMSPIDMMVVEDGKRPAIRLNDGRMIALTPQLAAHLIADVQQVTILDTSDGVYAALHNYTWHPYKVLRIGHDTNSHPWQCEVWAAGNSVTAGGCGFYHWVTLVDRNDELLVFGVSDMSIYVEGFRKNDGACTLRFGTFWGQLPSP